jgi:hypothetical protein
MIIAEGYGIFRDIVVCMYRKRGLGVKLFVLTFSLQVSQIEIQHFQIGAKLLGGC